MDTRIVEDLNRWFARGDLLPDVVRAVILGMPLLLGVLLVWRWLTDRRPSTRATLLTGVIAAVSAIWLDALVGHLWYRARPFVVLPIHALASNGASSSFFPETMAWAGAATTALLVVRSRLVWPAGLFSACLALAVVAAGLHYPSDAVAGFAVGTAVTVALVPLRGRLTAMVAAAGTAAPEESPAPDRTGLRPRVLWLAVVMLLLAGAAGYEAKAFRDKGPLTRAARQLALKTMPPRPPRVFSASTVATISAGHYPGAGASVVAQVTAVTQELDGDIHVQLQAGSSFLIGEIVPELEIPPPNEGALVTAWGIVRYDAQHGWWELHPLLGWAKGNVLPSRGGEPPGD